MNTTSISFQNVLDALLSDRKDFPRTYLQQFSDIGALELKSLLDVWPRVKPSRKLTLLEELDTLAETDTLVSFDDFARALLTDPEPDVRTRAIRLLDECEDTKLVPSYLDMLKNDPDINIGEEEDAEILSAVIWSLSQIGGEDVRTYLENLLDVIEDDDEQIASLEEALDNLAFTEDLDRFDLLAVDPDDELKPLDEDDEE